MRRKFLQNRRLAVPAFNGVEGAVHVGGDGHIRPPNFQPFQESAQGFVGRCNDSGVEGVGGGEGHTREALLLEHGHGGLDRFGFAGDNGHLWRVFVGRNHIAIGGLEHRFNRFVGSGDAGHQAFVVDFNRTHFRAAGGCCSQSTVHVQNSRGHERSVFTKRMPGDHIRRVPVGIERSFNRQVGCQHRRLHVLRLLEFVLRFLQFFFAQGRAQHKSRERLTT